MSAVWVVRNPEKTVTICSLTDRNCLSIFEVSPTGAYTMAIRQSSRTRPFPFIADKNGHEVDREAVFGYLEAVRLSGKINMLGAPPYIVDQFKVSKADTMTLFTAWCEHKQHGN